MAKAAPADWEIESHILETLQGERGEVHTEELAARLGLSRHTVAKYLQVLHAKGAVRMRRVGNAKLWRAAESGLRVRPLALDDLSQILQIEERLRRMRRAALPTGVSSETELETFAQTVEYHLECSDPSLCLGAELDGELVGFIFGEIRLWEFGGGGKTGWIKILAVDPDYWRRGIGRKLGEELLSHFRRRGIHRVRTLVDSYSGELIAYFRSLGFQIMNMLPLELSMDTTDGGRASERSPQGEDHGESKPRRGGE